EAVEIGVARVGPLNREAERERVADLQTERPGEPEVVAPAERERRPVRRLDVVEAKAAREPPEERRGEIEGVAAGDLLRIGAVHSGPAELRRRQEADVRRVKADRFGA